MRKVLLLTIALFLLSPILPAQTNRTFDGSMNNLSNPAWGMAAGHIMRFTSNGYSDTVSAMGGLSRPNPRLISNLIFNQDISIPNDRNISDFGWSFGQFIDHDITFVDDNLSEPIPIPVPAFDPYFDPAGTGTVQILMRRSKSDPLTGTDPSNPRMHINDISSWMDGSNIYGSDNARANWLRTFTNGKLKTSAGNLLPFNTVTGEFGDAIDPTAPFMIIEGAPMPKHFVAGDLRANEQPTLTCMHTLFVREHNRVCDEALIAHPGWSDEELYQYARKMVGGYIQAIAFEEWLPALGIQIDPYSGYNNGMQPDIMNVFSAAAFRLGHTLLNGNLLRLDGSGAPYVNGNIDLKDAFFNPLVIKDDGGLEPFLQGMAAQRQQKFDAKVVSDIRNFLFGPPGAGGLDLVSININRGRERGLVDYNWIRQDVGLPKYNSFSDITSDPVLQANLLALYGSIENIDPWVGMLSEDHIPGSAVGLTVHTILKAQFTHLRDGDRFYYENDPVLTATEKQEIKQTGLSDIIKRNTTITLLQDNVFFVQDPMTALEEEIFGRDQASVRVFPNPVTDVYSLAFETVRDQKVDMVLTDMMGRQIETRQIQAVKGANVIRMELPLGLSRGVYLLTLHAGNDRQVVRLVKQG
jgi:hypothetical protein